MAKEKICAVYQILNTKNGKRYIGVSIDCRRRWKQHTRKLNSNTHENVHLQNAWNKYGQCSFEFSTVEVCLEDLLAQREIFWIQQFNSYQNGYNRSLGGDGTFLARFSPERNRKISERQRGKKKPHLSGDKSPTASPVVCLNTGVSYGSAITASNELSLSYPSIIRSCKYHTKVRGSDYVFVKASDYAQMTELDIASIIERSNHTRDNMGSVRRSVICLNTGEIFTSPKDASKKYHRSYSNLMHCCRGEAHSYGQSPDGTPLAWMYYDEYINADSKTIYDRIYKAKHRGKSRK